MATSPDELNSLNIPTSDKCYSSINGDQLKDLFLASLLWLKSNQQIVNSLNVFPVPDGDTGTNMFLTMQSAYNEIAEIKEKNIGKTARLIAQGALMGARGNSGVILSQLLRGFARVLDDHESMDAELLVKALEESRNTAYKGVVRPVEGTILTVAKDIAQSSQIKLKKSVNLIEILTDLVDQADKSVKNTPELLPILKQAGVVDSGGKGLFYILEGMLRKVSNLPVEVDNALHDNLLPIQQINLKDINETIEPGQDFEIVVDFSPNSDFNLDIFYSDLSEIGTSVQVGEGDDLYRMHIHVAKENKYKPIDYVSKKGIVKKVYIENLNEQVNKRASLIPSIKPDQIVVVTVSPGEGITKIFQSLGAAAIIKGGQTMNPSTKEILKSFENLPNKKIIILPNNKNIILTAEAVKSMSSKKVTVIPSRSIPQGLSACLHLDPDGDYEEIIKDMNESLLGVETGEITTATRSIKINNVNVKKGEVIALHNGNLLLSAQNLIDASVGLLKKIDADKKEHITIFYGQKISQNEIDSVVEAIKNSLPQQEIEVHEGGQPFYQFILSIE